MKAAASTQAWENGFLSKDYQYMNYTNLALISQMYKKIDCDWWAAFSFSKNDGNSYQEGINNLAGWCTESNPLLNVNKTKTLIVTFTVKRSKDYIYRPSVVSVRSGAQRVLKDNTNLSHSPFTLLPSAERYRSICSQARLLVSSGCATPQLVLCILL